MLEIGVIVDQLKPDSNSFNLVNCLNILSKKHSCFLFILEHGDPKITKLANFSILNMESLFAFKGKLIATGLSNAQACNNSLYASSKYLYLNELEWMNLDKVSHYQLKNILIDDELNLIAKSKSYDKILSKLFKDTSGIVYNWDHEELLEVIK